MSTYYNEIDKQAASWLRELVKQGLIPDGEVDDRDMRDIEPRELDGFIQCHFFAGIGGWAHALRLAGWPDDRPVWTGSCPCQPFSQAGQGGGVDDERHLWPDWRWLIDQCRPPVIFGEQVASKLGRSWLAGVQADLEALAYRRAAADLCAAGVYSPNIRQRLWWVAEGGLGNAVSARLEGHGGDGDGGSEPGRVGQDAARSASPAGAIGGSADADGRREKQQPGDDGEAPCCEEEARQEYRAAVPERSSATGFWSAFDILHCTDGKARRIEPGTFPLAHGVPARVGRLRGYGNAINPHVAKVFIESYLECRI